MEQETTKSDQIKINPNEMVNETGKDIDYTKIIEIFGCEFISKKQIEKFEKLTGKPCHVLLKREIFFSQRDFDVLLQYMEQKKPIFLYTGRGPSTDSMHLGHLLPFIFTQYLQDVLKCPLVIQLSDDEKFFYQKDTHHELDYFRKVAVENTKDIIACGFDPERTFIFRNTDYAPEMYINICKIQKAVTYNQVKGIFGFNGSESCGKVAFPAIQATPCLGSSFKHIFGDNDDVLCIVPMGIDQDPYFRMTRDVALKLKFPKPVCIHSKFFPALQGFKSKMSSSDQNSAIFLNDTYEQIKTKIQKYAFSGGRTTVEEHKKLGADLEVDIPYNYLRFFLEDEHKLKEITENYGSGKMLTGEIKAIAVEVLSKIVKGHQDRRAAVTMSMIDDFMKKKPLNK